MIQRLCSSFSRMMSWLNVLQAYLDNLVWVSKPCRPWEYFDLYFSTWCFITKYKYLIAVIGAWCQRPIRGSSVHPGVSVEYRPILQERSSFIKSRQQVGAQFYSLIHFVQPHAEIISLLWTNFIEWEWSVTPSPLPNRGSITWCKEMSTHIPPFVVNIYCWFFAYFFIDTHTHYLRIKF